MKDWTDGGTDELVVRMTVFSSEDAFGNERASAEHSGQKIEILNRKEEEEDLTEFLVGA